MQQTHKLADQSPSCAIINIKNSRLRTLIGFNPEEKVRKQDVVLNIEINYNIDNDVLSMCSDHPGIRSSRVTIDKPHALRFADSVSLTLEQHASRADSQSILEKAS